MNPFIDFGMGTSKNDDHSTKYTYQYDERVVQNITGPNYGTVIGRNEGTITVSDFGAIQMAGAVAEDAVSAATSATEKAINLVQNKGGLDFTQIAKPLLIGAAIVAAVIVVIVSFGKGKKHASE